MLGIAGTLHINLRNRTFDIAQIGGCQLDARAADIVDLVVILAPAPEHARLAKAAIAAGKDVYSEWPLTTKTSDSEELLA